jgi:hypothetical protein
MRTSRRGEAMHHSLRNGIRKALKINKSIFRRGLLRFRFGMQLPTEPQSCRPLAPLRLAELGMPDFSIPPSFIDRVL